MGSRYTLKSVIQGTCCKGGRRSQIRYSSNQSIISDVFIDKKELGTLLQNPARTSGICMSIITLSRGMDIMLGLRNYNDFFICHLLFSCK